MNINHDKLKKLQNEYATAYNNLASEIEKRGIDLQLLIKVDQSLRKLLKT